MSPTSYQHANVKMDQTSPKGECENRLITEERLLEISLVLPSGTHTASDQQYPCDGWLREILRYKPGEYYHGHMDWSQQMQHGPEGASAAMCSCSTTLRLCAHVILVRGFCSGMCRDGFYPINGGGQSLSSIRAKNKSGRARITAGKIG